MYDNYYDIPLWLDISKLVKNLSLSSQSTTEKWLSTDKTSMHNDNQPILKKLKDLSKVVYKDTNIDFKVSSGLCSGGVMVVKRLNELKKV